MIERKRILLGFCDFWAGAENTLRWLVGLLGDRYDIVIADNPASADYVLYSVFGSTHKHLPAKSVKICFSGEDICPDFNFCDYAIGSEMLEFGDRYLNFSVQFWGDKSMNTQKLIDNRALIPDPQLLDREFCSFVVSNGISCRERTLFFEELSKYKTIGSGGRHLNNIGYCVGNKIEFCSRYKFSICFENSSHPGYVTEKIFDAYASSAIPIYWGDTQIDRIFNPGSFINVNKLGFDAAIDAVKYLDRHDNDYLEMIRQPVFNNPDEYSSACQQTRLKDFFCHIFDYPTLQEAYRYNRDWYIRRHTADYLLGRKYSRINKSSILRVGKQFAARLGLMRLIISLRNGVNHQSQ